MKKAEFANSVNLGEVAHNEPPHLILHCVPYGENLIARCSQVHDNFTMGVNRKILINLIYLFIQETYLTCANGL